ncbi:MAG TPA: hypothetical protein ENJ18_08780, partial [Nannocystis exedens]|nr:hypothetical protein [Nannocystis exedens]
MILAIPAAFFCLAVAASTGTDSQALAVAATPPAAASTDEKGQATPTTPVREASSIPVAPGNLVIRAGSSGSVTIRESGGRIVEQIELRLGEAASRSLPPGRYIVTDDHGSKWAVVLEKEGTMTLTTAPQDQVTRPPRESS